MNKVIVKISREPGFNVNIPEYKTEEASGFDLESAEHVIIQPGETATVSTGWRFDVPRGYEIQIRPRSGMSATTKVRIANSPGTIDSDFRGHVKIILDNNHTDKPFVIKKGARIAQGVLAPIARAEFILDDNLSKTGRGEGGFGSTGQ
jgi:dUTP pyrophosphatase